MNVKEHTPRVSNNNIRQKNQNISYHSSGSKRDNVRRRGFYSLVPDTGQVVRVALISSDLRGERERDRCAQYSPVTQPKDSGMKKRYLALYKPVLG